MASIPFLVAVALVVLSAGLLGLEVRRAMPTPKERAEGKTGWIRRRP